MKVKQIDVAEKSAVVEFMGKDRLVTFSENGDIDVEPFSDLSDDEGEELLFHIMEDHEIGAAFPFED